MEPSTQFGRAIRNYFAGWSLWEKLWLVISTALIVTATIIWKDKWYGVIASLTGIWCVVLAAKGRISNYFFGIANTLFYAYVAYTWSYYGEVMLNLIYFLPMQFYGLWFWKKSENVSEANPDQVNIKFLSNRGRLLWSGISVIAVIGYGFVLRRMGGKLPFIDSASTVLSVIAMILMARIYMEQWILWIIIDVLSVGMWFVVVFRDGGNDVGVLLMWTAFLINAVYGLINWIKRYKLQKAGAES